MAAKFQKFMLLNINNTVFMKHHVLFILLCFTMYCNGQGTGEKISPEQMAVFKTRAVSVVADLNRHIAVMIDKSDGSSGGIQRRKTAVELALLLFTSDTSIVEVSSLRSPKKKRLAIRKYLNNIQLLAYKRVEITWYGIYLSSDFIERNGKYYGTATITQKFEGTSNIELGKYVDITTKNIQVVVEQVEEFKGISSNKRWVLRLGDITVDETRD